VPPITEKAGHPGYCVNDMAAAKLLPDLFFQPDYTTWLRDVRRVLTIMHMEMDAWQENWNYDFRKAYNAGATARDAAVHAYDFWWQHVLDESWT
jgi:hypothetical protein